MRTLIAALAAVLCLGSATGNRRITQNQQSPPAETSATIGGQTVTIEYNAPSARGRKVEGGLIPHGTVWRFGADSATTLTTNTDLMIGSLKVPKGVYTLYVLASPESWKLIVNKQTGQWGTSYSEGQDLGRTDMKVTKLSSPAEKLKITLTPSSLEAEWGNTKATVPVKGL